MAPAQSLWTTEASESVQLRMDELCPEQPITVHQMFTNSVQKYGKLTALASKRGNKWEKVTFSEYYHLSRMAAKSFLKVIIEQFLNTNSYITCSCNKVNLHSSFSCNLWIAYNTVIFENYSSLVWSGSTV